MNSAVSSATKVSPIQIIQGFNSNYNELGHLAELNPKDWKALRYEYRDMAKEAIAFAEVTAKDRYDRKHKPIRFKPGD